MVIVIRGLLSTSRSDSGSFLARRLDAFNNCISSLLPLFRLCYHNWFLHGLSEGDQINLFQIDFQRFDGESLRRVLWFILTLVFFSFNANGLIF